jgi:hypothetical protein
MFEPKNLNDTELKVLRKLFNSSSPVELEGIEKDIAQSFRIQGRICRTIIIKRHRGIEYEADVYWLKPYFRAMIAKSL